MILIPDFIVILGPVTSRKCDTRQNIYRLMYTFTSNTSNASICTNDSVVTSFSIQVCSEPILSPKSSFKRVRTGIKPVYLVFRPEPCVSQSNNKLQHIKIIQDGFFFKPFTQRNLFWLLILLVCYY